MKIRHQNKNVLKAKQFCIDKSMENPYWSQEISDLFFASSITDCYAFHLSGSAYNIFASLDFIFFITIYKIADQSNLLRLYSPPPINLSVNTNTAQTIFLNMETW
jgi:hypothetical protein